MHMAAPNNNINIALQYWMISFCLLLIILYLILDTHKYSKIAAKCSLSRTSKINDNAAAFNARALFWLFYIKPWPRILAAMLLCFGKKRHYTLRGGKHLFFRPLELRILATTPPTTTPTPRAGEGRTRSQFYAPVPCPPRHVPKTRRGRTTARPHRLPLALHASPPNPTRCAQSVATYRPIIKLAHGANL